MPVDKRNGYFTVKINRLFRALHLLRGTDILGCFSVPSGTIYFMLGGILAFSQLVFSAMPFISTFDLFPL